jgi:hypothetical protein
MERKHLHQRTVHRYDLGDDVPIHSGASTARTTPRPQCMARYRETMLESVHDEAAMVRNFSDGIAEIADIGVGGLIL